MCSGETPCQNLGGSSIGGGGGTCVYSVFKAPTMCAVEKLPVKIWEGLAFGGGGGARNPSVLGDGYM